LVVHFGTVATADRSAGENNEEQEMTRTQSASVEVTDAPEIDETAELMKLAGNSTRLKLLYLLETMTEVNVSDLSELLGVSVSAVSQHLAKLRARGLVNSRRDAQTIYYRLTEHDFIGRLREEYFGAWAN
jgi:DNA-binding transcriptional ArsR family regulator